MIDATFSILAWISVVLIQALIHYFVLGSRRLHKKEISDGEESLSLATAEGTEFTSDDSISYEGAFFSRNDSRELSEYSFDETVLIDGPDPQELLKLLSHTGAELLKVRRARVGSLDFSSIETPD